jgi:hypothetical protein
MKNHFRRILPILAVAVLTLALAAPAGAQQNRFGGPRPIVVPPLPPAGANYLLPNGMTYQQYINNLILLGNAYSQIPPYVFGYNPYPQAIINNYSPVYSTPFVMNPYYPVVSPFATPFVSPGFYTNPYFSFFRGYP